MSPELLAIFNKICGELTEIHGEPAVHAPEPTDRFGEGREMVTACWFLNGANNGFKIYEGSRGRVQVLTWADAGDFAHAEVTLRSAEAAEDALRRVLPPALADAQGAPELVAGIDVHACATAVIESATEDIDFIGMAEQHDDAWAHLSPEDYEKVHRRVDKLVSAATVTVTWPEAGGR